MRRLPPRQAVTRRAAAVTLPPGRASVHRSPTMIKAIRFQNYKVLRDTTLPLGSFTLLIGPNGSGKSTAISAIRNAPRLEPRVSSDLLASAGATSQEVTLTLQWGPPLDGVV